MKQIKTLLINLILLSLSVCIMADVKTTEFGFETTNQGWTPICGNAELIRNDVAQGQGALSLSQDNAPEAWVAVLELLSTVETGNTWQLSLSFKSTNAANELLVALASDIEKPQTVLLTTKCPADNKWHRLALTIVSGLDAPKLLLGMKGEGKIQVDALRCEAVKIKPVTKKIPAELKPEYAEPLAENWEPTGPSPLQTREILGETKTWANAGPFEITPPADEIILMRGERTGFNYWTFSRGEATRPLLLSPRTPLGWPQERSSFPVVGRRSGELNIPVQALQVGKWWLSLKMGSDTESAEIPQQVTVQRSYPAFGVTQVPVNLPEEALRTLAQTPAQLVALTQGESQDRIEIFRKLGVEAIHTNATSLAQMLELAQQLTEEQRKATGLVTLPSLQTEADWTAVAQALLKEYPSAAILSPAFPMQLNSTGQLEFDESFDAAFENGLATVAQGLSVQLPETQPAIIVRQSLDGKGNNPIEALVQTDRATSLVNCYPAMAKHNIALPVFVPNLQIQSCGDPGLDALRLARSLTHIAATGATGACLPAQDQHYISLLNASGMPNEPVRDACRELIRELSAVIPVQAPRDSEIAGQDGSLPINYRVFIRGDEGIVAMWNNTAQTQPVAIEIDNTPRQIRLLRISWPGETVQREFNDDFKWDELAIKARKQAVFTDIEPLQFVIVSMKLSYPGAWWLRGISPKPHLTEDDASTIENILRP